MTHFFFIILRRKRFQSTHPRRVWLTVASALLVLTVFQSTHPRRVWPQWWANKRRASSFNPHTHEGCDFCCLPVRISHSAVSIHTPTKGVTQITKDRVYDVKFQSTHPRRVWHSSLLLLQIVLLGFNPHTHEGCDCLLPRLQVALWSFNPHTHEGCDRILLHL